MSLNLLKTVQENLGYPELQKIDPNTAEIVVDNSTPNEDKFSQSAIPAVLTGLYREFVKKPTPAKQIYTQCE